MSGLEKATLTRLKNDANDEEDGEPIPVQFNPASLRLTLSNNTEGGTNRGRQQRQFTGNASTELAFDLFFDTADEDDGAGKPRSVREKTAMVEQFVLAQGSGSARKSPPRVKFHWDKLIIKGVITSVSVDFDLFASNGTPLRAKVGVSIKEQDARYEIGTSTEAGAPAPGESGRAGPGSSGGGSSDPKSNRSAAAIEGESAAEFAARVGLDPAAWRGLAAGLDGTLSLSAGAEIDFDASLGLSVGVGSTVGFEADVGVSLEASLGLEASASISAGAGAGARTGTASGFALSAAGGVSAAAETVKIAEASAATSATVKAFAAPAPAGGVALAGSGTVARSGAAATSAAAGQRTASPANGGSAGDPPPIRATSSTPQAYAPPRADPRATSFGFGVPLRPAVTGAAASTQGVVALRPYARASDVPVTRDPTVPAWVQLPTQTAPAAGAVTPAPTPASSAPRPASGGRHRTGCGCGCGPGGGAR